MDIEQLTLVIHHEKDSWWTEIREIPGFYAVDDTKDGSLELAYDYILDNDNIPDGTPIMEVDADSD